MEEAVAGALALHGIDDSDSDADGAESDGSEIAAPEQATAAPAGPQRAGACPVCRGAVAPGAGVCGGCGLSLRAEGKVHCPRCGETADAADEVCECGALLSLQALESRFDSTVRYVCARCKQLWQEYKTACPDCDGRLVGAEALRALFNRG